LLEVGTGFNGNDRQGKYLPLNGSPGHDEITSKLDEIIDFSGCPAILIRL
jgi:hypothetical protein